MPPAPEIQGFDVTERRFPCACGAGAFVVTVGEPKAPRSFPESQSGFAHWSVDCAACAPAYAPEPWWPSRQGGVTTLHFLRCEDAGRLDREQADVDAVARAHAHVVRTRDALFPGAGW